MAEIRVNATGGLKLFDADDSHYAQIIAGTITSNVNAITLGHDVVSIVDNLALTSDSSVLKFGADNDTTLTHTDGTGLTLNSTNKLCFNDASQFVQGSSATVLSIGATDEIDLTATAVDLNGTLDVSGNSQFSGTITVGVDDTGKDVKLFGATSGSFLLWDESADSLLLTDSTPIKIGDAQDLTLYHDGTNSYITNAVGALKIATETSGIALTIGHTTSETTIADNLTVTGSSTLAGGTMTAGFDFNDSVKARFGTGNDLEIFHDGDDSYIIDNGTGHLRLKGDDVRIYNAAGTELKATFVTDGAVTLYHDNATTITTVAEGLVLGSVGDDASDIKIYRNATRQITVVGSNGSQDCTFNHTGTFNVSGEISKGSGSFKIKHPLEDKKNTHYLVHSFIEGPKADLIYRGKVTLSSGTATVNIDTVSGMTDGTFVVLCDDIQCFTTNESDWDAVKGSMSGNTLTVNCENASSTATVSWMVIGDRKDEHMIVSSTEWTDGSGKPIIEPLQPEPEPE